MKKVKIYGTLGPACSDPDVLKNMFEEGMDGIRLNMSHTALIDASDLIDAYQRAAALCGKVPDLLIDMQGPELRIGALKEPVTLAEGICIRCSEIPFPQAVKYALAASPEGQDVLLDDGRILLRTVGTGSTDGDGAKGERDPLLRVIRGGVLKGRKSIALPGIEIHSPALTQKDIENIGNARRFGVTAVMQPFVRSRDDLAEVRTALDAAGCRDIRLLAKIENKAGADNIEDLIPLCDEIVIARGDLGNSMDLWELPAVQKRISAVCRRAGRDFMVVTQMLDSMTHKKVPTRAEVSDIFNAVLDGASSVMVTGETAAGENPDLVIRYLANTVREAMKFETDRKTIQK